MTAVKEYGINYYYIDSENDFQIDSVIFDIVWPGKSEELDSIEDTNDTSLAVVIKYNKTTFFTAGDLSSDYEQKALTDAGYNSIDILKSRAPWKFNGHKC